jgi:hypothetical protein
MPITGGRALRVLGDAQPVVDGRVAPGRTGARRRAASAGTPLTAATASGAFSGRRTKSRQAAKLRRVAALGHKGLVDQALLHHHMGQRVEHRDIGAGLQLQVLGGADVRAAHQLDAARVDHDQPRALAHAALQARGEHRVRVGRVGADDDDQVGALDRLGSLRAGRGAEGLAQAVAGGRVADARAGVDVVAAEGGAHQLLHQVGFLVGAAARGDAAQGRGAMRRLDGLERAAAKAIASSQPTVRQGSLMRSRMRGASRRSLCVA